MLISGVFRRTGKRALLEISGLSEEKFDCCVDVGYAAHRHRRQRQRSARLGDHAPLRQPHRRDRELSHAAQPRRAVAGAARRRGSFRTPWCQTTFRRAAGGCTAAVARMLISEYFKFLPTVAHLTVARAAPVGAAELARRDAGRPPRDLICLVARPALRSLDLRAGVLHNHGDVRRRRLLPAARPAPLRDDGPQGARHRLAVAAAGRSSARAWRCAGARSCPSRPTSSPRKHQSAWDTFALIPIFSDPALVMKAELTHIPFYGWFSRKFEHVFVRRDRGPARPAPARARRAGPGERRPRGADLPRRHAPRAGRRARLQARRRWRSMRASGCRACRWRSIPGSTGRGAADALPRHHRRRDPRSAAGRAAARASSAPSLQRRIETASNRLIVEAARSPEPPPIAAEVLAPRRSGSGAASAAEFYID